MQIVPARNGAEMRHSLLFHDNPQENTEKSWYDTAQICLNGHSINSMSESYPESNKKFCDKCGEPTITKCQKCDSVIRGYHHVPGVFTGSEYKLPKFCHECGAPYSWTGRSLTAAKELSEEMENLSPEEKELLKRSLDEIIRDSPQTQVAAQRFKRRVVKAGTTAGEGMKEILIGVVSEAAKRVLWP